MELILNGHLLHSYYARIQESTLCRALYAVLSGISVDKKEIEKYRENRLSKLTSVFVSYFQENMRDDEIIKLKKWILESIKEYQKNKGKFNLKNHIIVNSQIGKSENNEKINKLIEQINDTIFNVSDDKIHLTIIS